MKTKRAAFLAAICLPLFVAAGCRSPYYADQGALLGALGGAGVGAAVGDAHGNAPAGALIGTVAGAMAGSAVGGALDDIEARNQALIQAQLGRRLAGAATMQDVIAMSRAGVGDEVIITHIRNHGMARPVSAGDLILLKQQGVSDAVMRAVQQPPPPPVAVRQPPPGPVIVEQPYGCGPSYYGSPYWRHWPRRYPRYRPFPPGGVHWGVSVSD